MCCTFSLPAIYPSLHFSICLFLFLHHASIHLTISLFMSSLSFFNSTFVSSSNPQTMPSFPAFVSLSTPSSVPHLFSPSLHLYPLSMYKQTLRLPYWNSTWTLPAAQSDRLATGGFLCWQWARQVLWGLWAHEATTTFWSSFQAITGLHFSLVPVVFCTELTNTYTETHIQVPHTQTIYQLPKPKGEIGLWKRAQANIVHEAITRRRCMSKQLARNNGVRKGLWKEA